MISLQNTRFYAHTGGILHDDSLSIFFALSGRPSNESYFAYAIIIGNSTDDRIAERIHINGTITITNHRRGFIDHSHSTFGSQTIVALSRNNSGTDAFGGNFAIFHNSNLLVTGTPANRLMGSVTRRNRSGQRLSRADASKAQAGFVQADARNCNGRHRHSNRKLCRTRAVTEVRIIIGVDIRMIFT